MARRSAVCALLPAMLLCLDAVSLAGEAGTGPQQAASRRQGEALFNGGEPLSGTLRGNASPMPPEVLACGGCHKPKPGGTSDVPVLDAANLEASKVRRNGPPSAYTQETFCRVLRSGVDPVYITLSRNMPVFTMNQQQCESLWLYLTDGKSP